MTTPEGKVKAAIDKVLEQYGARIYRFMFVPSGYGQTTVDYLGCFEGKFFAIEAKRPGKKPTARQKLILADIQAAGGRCFVIDDAENTDELAIWLAAVDSMAKTLRAQVADTGTVK